VFLYFSLSHSDMAKALWAVMLLTYLPLHMKILNKGETYPKFPDLDCVYL
jgi:hypothetical protein